MHVCIGYCIWCKVYEGYSILDVSRSDFTDRTQLVSTTESATIQINCIWHLGFIYWVLNSANFMNVVALLMYGVLDVQSLRWQQESLLGVNNSKRYVGLALCSLSRVMIQHQYYGSPGCCSLPYWDNEGTPTNSWTSIRSGQGFPAQMSAEVWFFFSTLFFSSDFFLQI